MKIVLFPHPALRHRCVPLTAITEQKRTQARKMLDLMYEARGIGLAANQVALPYQMLVMNVTADPEQRDQELVLINPVILERKGSVEGEEGCLSFPQLYQKIRRAKTVKVQGYNLEGQGLEITAQDLTARVLQHEIDHLHGVLYIDKMGTIAQIASRSTLAQFKRDYRKAQGKGEIPADTEIEKTLTALEGEA
jgi:peptide deformylase